MFIMLNNKSAILIIIVVFFVFLHNYFKIKSFTVANKHTMMLSDKLRELREQCKLSQLSTLIQPHIAKSKTATIRPAWIRLFNYPKYWLLTRTIYSNCGSPISFW